MPLALLEHVNLNVPDHDAAYAFYVTALGGVVNPKTTNERQLHVNVGASQFHLLLQASFAEGIEKVTIPQVWAGHIELWSREPLETIQQRLTEAGRSFTREEASAASGGKPHLLAVCPWGNRYLVRTAPDGFNAEAHGSHPGGIGGLRVTAAHLLVDGARREQRAQRAPDAERRHARPLHRALQLRPAAHFR